MHEKSLTTLKTQVYDSLLSDIISGVYTVDTILTEKFLIEKYNVSRAPVREALVQMTANHILLSIPRQGYKIFRPTAKQLAEVMAFRSCLECYFLGNYFVNIEKSLIKELKKTSLDWNNCPKNDFMARWRCNTEFHLKLFSIYGNNYAYKLLEDALNIQTIAFIQANYPFTIDLHIAFVDYLEKGEIATAVAILKADIGNFLLPNSGHIPIDQR